MWRRGKCKFSPQEVFLSMREGMWLRGNCKFSPQDVFRLMWEAMWWRGKCKFSPHACGTCPGSVMIALPSLHSDKL